jgi:dsRNA-specific ribonuclease
MNSISAPTSSSSTTLKRTRSTHNTETLNTTFRPLLPKITGEHILQVFTHKSLRRSADSAQDECGDNERLSELGEKVLEAVVTHNLFTQRPMLKAMNISVRFQPRTSTHALA